MEKLSDKDLTLFAEQLKNWFFENNKTLKEISFSQIKDYQKNITIKRQKNNVAKSYKNVAFDWCDFDHSNFENCNFENVTFSNCYFYDSGFINCKLKNVNFNSCYFDNNCHIRNCEIDNINSLNTIMNCFPAKECIFKNVNFDNNDCFFYIPSLKFDFAEGYSSPTLNFMSNSKFQNCTINYNTILNTAQKATRTWGPNYPTAFFDFENSEVWFKELLVIANLFNKIEIIKNNDIIEKFLFSQNKTYPNVTQDDKKINLNNLLPNCEINISHKNVYYLSCEDDYIYALELKDFENTLGKETIESIKFKIEKLNNLTINEQIQKN